MAIEGSVSGVPPSHCGAFCRVKSAERVDQEVVYRADLVVVHPLPQHEDERARYHRRDQEDHPVDGGEPLIRHAVDEDRKKQREDDRAGQEHDGEERRPPKALPHQRVFERGDVIIEADPVRRLVRQELVVGEADPEDADDRIDLVSDEKDERRKQKQPRAKTLPERADPTGKLPLTRGRACALP